MVASDEQEQLTHLVARWRDGDIAAFEAEAEREGGLFHDHLRRMLVSLSQDPELCDAVRNVLRRGPSPSAESFYRLQSAGVMAGDAPEHLQPRCRLYATYLARHLL